MEFTCIVWCLKLMQFSLETLLAKYYFAATSLGVISYSTFTNKSYPNWLTIHVIIECRPLATLISYWLQRQDKNRRNHYNDYLSKKFLRKASLADGEILTITIFYLTDAKMSYRSQLRSSNLQFFFMVCVKTCKSP